MGPRFSTESQVLYLLYPAIMIIIMIIVTLLSLKKFSFEVSD